MEKLKEHKIRYIIIAIVAILVIALYRHEMEYRKPVNVVDQHVEGDDYIVTLDGPGSCYLGKEHTIDITKWTKTDQNRRIWAENVA